MFYCQRVAATLLLFAFASSALAQSASEPLIAYPPDGERLRLLADRLNFKIGYASRYNWQALQQAPLYEQIVSQEFNIATPENSMKWEFIHPQQSDFEFADMDNLAAFADLHSMALHAHPLLWYRQNPLWAETLPGDEIEAAMLTHIDTLVSRYRDRVSVWDVVNEGLLDDGSGLRPNIFLDAIGPSYIDRAFVQARLSDPNTQLIYNDYDVGWLTPKADAMYELVVDMLARDIPIDGVGMQMHIDHTFEHGEGFSSNMQRFADRDLDIYISEFDVGVLQVEDYQQQSLVYEDIIRRCLMQPRCKALQIWGVDDVHSWRPFFDPLPFDDEFQVKPAYFGMQRALQTQPLHPENCELGEATVVAGTVYLVDSVIICRSVPLAGGFQSLSVRYRNTGVNTPTLMLSVAGNSIGSVALPPTPVTAESDFSLVDFAVTPLTDRVDIELSLSGDVSSVDVGVDALLFGDPSNALDVSLDGGTAVNRNTNNHSGFGAMNGLTILLGLSLIWLRWVVVRR